MAAIRSGLHNLAWIRQAFRRQSAALRYYLKTRFGIVTEGMSEQQFEQFTKGSNLAAGAVEPTLKTEANGNRDIQRAQRSFLSALERNYQKATA